MGEIADALRQARDAPPTRDSRRGAAIPASLAPRSGLDPLPTSPEDDTASPDADRILDGLEQTLLARALANPGTLEACRGVAVNLRAELEKLAVRSIAVVSAIRDEGKTLATCNLALGLASLSEGRAVAVVDLDLRSPSIAPLLGIRPELGMEDFLAGKAELEDIKVTIRQPAIDVFPVAEPTHGAHELLVLPRLAEAIRALETRYEAVVIDTPPSLIVSDTKLIMKHVGACVPVARVGYSRANQFRQLLETLPRDRVLGELLTGTRLPRHGYEYYYDKNEKHRVKDPAK